MKKVMCVFAMLVMLGVLCAGCQKTDKPAPTAVKESSKSDANNWQPETAAPPATGGEHEGHDHGPGGHDH